MKNQEIIRKFSSQLSSGRTFVADIQPSDNGKHTILLVQQVDTSDDNPLSMFIGSPKRILRTLQTATNSNVNNFEIGNFLNFNLVCEETFEEQYSGQSPKINPSTGEIVTIDKRAVYETTRIPRKNELGGIKRLPRVETTIEQYA